MSANPAVRVVLLTGVAEPLGSAVAIALLRSGARVAGMVDREWQVARARTSLLEAANAGGATGADALLIGVVTAGDAEAAAGFVKGAADALGPITDFVAAAGTVRAPIAGREPAGDLQELLVANFVHNATVARAVLPSMRRRGRGQLTFVGSSPDGGGAWSATCVASKAALEGFARALARDLAATGVAVRVVPAPLEPVASTDLAASSRLIQGLVGLEPTS